MRKNQVFPLIRKQNYNHWASLLWLLITLSLLLSACQPTITSSPTPSPAVTIPVLDTPQPPLPANQLNGDWGFYLAEREWGNPREALKGGDGWSFTYTKALTTPYQSGDDGIAGLTNQDLSVAFSFAFYRTGEPYLTERLYGLDGPSGKYGETVLEDRVFHETTPNQSYTRYEYHYPYQADYSQAMIEYAKFDNQTLVAQVDLTGLQNATDAALHLVPELWFPEGGQINRVNEKTWDAVLPNGHLVIVAGENPTSWQMTQNQYPTRAEISANLVKQDSLSNTGQGNKAAWDFKFNLSPNQQETLRFGIAFNTDLQVAQENAQRALSRASELLLLRKTEADGMYINDVTNHQEVYQAALMNLLGNKMYYRYNGSYQSEWKGKINIHDVILVPDKWEFPWPAMWDTCFQANVATLADLQQAKHDLSLFLSDRWQAPGGHVPNVEWDLLGETPPLFAWAAWQIYQKDGDKAFLESLFPSMEKHFTYLQKADDRDHDSLFTGGFMGMDNIPRPGGANEEDADLSGWMAFFAQHMVLIANELGKPDRAQYYQDQYDKTIQEINQQLWDPQTGFYYDRNASGPLLEKSYTGLIPFIAGASTPEQTRLILEKLKDPQQFWTPYGIRSLSADSDLYEPGYSESGWKNSNWRGPIWMPINYLLVQRLEGIDPVLADQLREALINNVEGQWQATGHFYEYYNAETGEGLGADHQTGWTALVANLIHEKYAVNQ